MARNTDKLPRGLICPLVTPLQTGDVLDRKALARLIDHVGVSVDAVCLGDVFWGEGLVLSHETRLELAKAALEIIRGRWPVFITVTSYSAEATRDLLMRIETFVEHSDYTGSLFWVDYPIYYHSNRGLPKLYETMSHDTKFGFILGNHPELIVGLGRPVKHKNIRTCILKKVSQIEKVSGLIFRGSLKRSLNYQKAVRHCRGFKFYDGDEGIFMRQPNANGVVAGGANLLSKAWQEITWACLNQYDPQQHLAQHTGQILETGVLLREFYQLYSQNPAAILKRMLHVAGILPHAHTASVTKPSTPNQNRAVEALCRKHDLL